MPGAEERLVNLAMLIASSATPVTAAQVRAQIAGYPTDQDEAAFLRMFERDKEHLRAAGLAIEVERSGEAESYRLDAAATYSDDLALSAEEATLLRVAGAAALADPSFPFTADLRMALAKLAAAGGSPVPVLGPAPVSALTADEDPEAQGEAVARLALAASARKRVSFGYTNLAGRTAVRDVEPYGLYARDGRWYLVGRDAGANALRVFAVTRLRDLAVNPARPKSPDFERPEGFDVTDWMLLPFQYGTPDMVATVRFAGPAAARAEALTAGQGRLEKRPDGSALWRVPVADPRALASWVVENGPGLKLVVPEEGLRLLAEGLAAVVTAHGD